MMESAQKRLDLDQVIADLHHGSSTPKYKQPSQQKPLDSKMSGLSELYRVLIQDKSVTSAAFLGKLEDLFRGLRSCLLTNQLQQLANGASQVTNLSASQASQNNNQISENIVEIVLKGNQIIFEMMPDIQHSEELEIQMAQLISIFIENLGSPKAIVRKSTHKCIGTYVKLTKKLEFVILHIIHTGLENQNSRTRQHSMLVIPALLSLKQTVIDNECKEMMDLIQAVIKRIKIDQSEIVSKTGKKLLLELQKCYPLAFKNNYIDKIRGNEDKAICQAVFNNDESMLKSIINGSFKSEQQSQQSSSGQSHQNMSVVGREIVQPTQVAPGQNLIMEKQIEKDLDKIIIEAKRESRYPSAQNGLLFAFLREQQIEALNENFQWAERTNAIEAIESELTHVLSVTDKKMEFLPFSTAFLGFIVQYIKDANFKISITAIQITSKLLVLNQVNIKKYYTQLVTTLIEKLSDSKVVIRQAILKCCGLLIKNYDPILFAHQSIKFISHTNWHVREGILHLIANSIIVQNQQDELNGNTQNQNENIACSSQLISELCSLSKSESKHKLQMMAIDCLALCLDVTKNSSLTDKLIQHELGISQLDIEQGISKNVQIYNLIKDRLQTEQLPAMQIDGSIEFKPVVEPPVSTQLPPLTVQSVPIVESIPIHNRSPSPGKVQLQMRFQQERISTNEASQSINKQRDDEKEKLMEQNRQQSQTQEKLMELNRQQNSANVFSQEKLKEQTRLQNSISIVNQKPKEFIAPKIQTLGSNLKTEIDDGYVSPLKSALVGQSNNKKINHSMINTQGNKSQLIQSNNQSIEQKQEEKISLWLPKYQDTIKKEDQISPNTIEKTGRGAELSPHLRITQNTQPKVISSSSIQNAGSQLIIKQDAISNQDQNTRMTTNRANDKYQPIEIKKTPQTFQNNTDVKDRAQRPIINNTSPLIKQVQPLNNSYTPEQHQYQPRIIISTPDQPQFQPTQIQQTPEYQQRQIQSNQIRQRTLDSMSQQSQSPTNKFTVGNGLKNHDFISIQQSPLINDAHSSKVTQFGRIDNRLNNDMQNAQQKNMSQSSGAPGGFNVNKTLINERLQLLKSTFKYKNTSSEDHEVYSFDTNDSQLRNNIQSAQKGISNYNQRGITSLQANSNTQQKLYTDPQQTLNSFGQSNVSTNINNTNSNNNYPHSKNYSAQKQLQSSNNTTGQNFSGSGLTQQSNAYTNVQQHRTLRGLQGTPSSNQKSLNSAMGPVKAAAIPSQDFMNTIQVNKNQSNNTETNSYGSNNNLQASRRTQKPPMAKASNISLPIPTLAPGIQRASSVNGTDLMPPSVETLGIRNQNMSEAPQSHSTTTYNAPEEPLKNPEQQYKQALQVLKGDDWQAIFDSLNIMKRVALFHKELLFATQGPAQKECIKLIVKQTDNLRSQVSKNACMTLQVMFQELPTRDLDPSVDLVIGALIKKATDTNQFVSEQAEKALIMVCHACNETKVFNCLQTLNIRSNPLKQKTCMCYNNLISKLGVKIKGFREQEKLVKAVISMLKEQAQEVRQTAKLGVLTLKNGFSNSREFDQFLLRCNLTDPQIEQARKVIEQEDYESLSNFANTKYGGSMRGSSMDSRGVADAQRSTPYAPPRRGGAAGSDGFQQSQYLESNMTSTFLSGGAMPSQVYSNNSAASNGFGMTGGSIQAFKKRQPSVSKPVDPQLMEQFKNLIAQCSSADWSDKLQAIDNLTNWISEHSISIKQTQASKFIQLVDIECKLIQDNNAKVQMKALNHFSMFLSDDNLRQLIDQNLTMIIQALSNNLASTSPSVRNQSNQHLQILEDSTESVSQLVQPMVVQINLPNNRSKAQLLDRLSNLIPKIDSNTINKYVAPIIKSNNKIQSEATVNPKVRDALNSLEIALNSRA